MLEIDGSFGEGGGQVLRSAVSLSALLKKPVRVYNIRKKRKAPGLRPQHLWGVRAAARVTGARVEGDYPGSTELLFEPGPTRFGEYYFDIGTAGSGTLLLQTLLPPLCLAGGESTARIRGGTHVPLSPPFDYIKNVFLPALDNLGITVKAQIERFGFYPKGGGETVYHIRPTECVRGRDFTQRGVLTRVKGVSAVAGLPATIAERQRDAAQSVLGGIPAEIEIKEIESIGPGTYVFLAAYYENSASGFSSIGERGKRAERVGEEAARALLRHHATGAALDAHLADQMVLYLALSGEDCALATSEVTSHLVTNLHVLKKFLPFDFEIEGETGSPGRVSLKAASGFFV